MVVTIIILGQSQIVHESYTVRSVIRKTPLVSLHSVGRRILSTVRPQVVSHILSCYRRHILCGTLDDNVSVFKEPPCLILQKEPVPFVSSEIN